MLFPRVQLNCWYFMFLRLKLTVFYTRVKLLCPKRRKQQHARRCPFLSRNRAAFVCGHRRRIADMQGNRKYNEQAVAEAENSQARG